MQRAHSGFVVGFDDVFAVPTKPLAARRIQSLRGVWHHSQGLGVTFVCIDNGKASDEGLVLDDVVEDQADRTEVTALLPEDATCRDLSQAFFAITGHPFVHLKYPAADANFTGMVIEAGGGRVHLPRDDNPAPRTGVVATRTFRAGFCPVRYAVTRDTEYMFSYGKWAYPVKRFLEGKGSLPYRAGHLRPNWGTYNVEQNATCTRLDGVAVPTADIAVVIREMIRAVHGDTYADKL